MSDSKMTNAVRKALIQQEMVQQRKILQQEIQPIINAGGRLRNLFSPPSSSQALNKKTIILSVTALCLALLGRRRAGWLGRAARYLIINYPGLLRKFM